MFDTFNTILDLLRKTFRSVYRDLMKLPDFVNFHAEKKRFCRKRKGREYIGRDLKGL